LLRRIPTPMFKQILLKQDPEVSIKAFFIFWVYVIIHYQNFYSKNKTLLHFLQFLIFKIFLLNRFHDSSSLIVVYNYFKFQYTNRWPVIRDILFLKLERLFKVYFLSKSINDRVLFYWRIFMCFVWRMPKWAWKEMQWIHCCENGCLWTIEWLLEFSCMSRTLKTSLSSTKTWKLKRTSEFQFQTEQ
jgi:hypothetical protein